MIKISNINKVFNSDGHKLEALKNVSLNISQGEIFGIIGYSGAGKSTLLRCINRLEEANSGSILIDGLDITKLKGQELRGARKDIGMIFQHFNLLQQKTVFENIAFPLLINKFSKEEINSRVMELLEYVGLMDKKDAYPSQLSGGQKQRVAIARAIANRPKILLSDEGTSALDPRTTENILELLKNINRDLGITIVMVTHQMEVVKEICQSVAIMEEGRVVEVNRVENLFTQPKTKTARLFINSLQGSVQEEIIDSSNFQGKILRLGFLGDSAKKPLISQLVRSFNVDVNILSGNINKLQMSSVGHLIVELLGQPQELERAIDYLRDDNILVEVI